MTSFENEGRFCFEDSTIGKSIKAWFHLRGYLDTHLDDAHAHARPLAILPLAKERFINMSSGVVTEPVALRSEVDRLLETVPQVAALLEWENDVLRATGLTLSALLNLVPASKRSSESYPPELDAVLSQLASAAVGRSHVEADRRSAVVQALVPILADQIVSQARTGIVRANWERAVTRFNDQGIDKTIAGSGHINRMLHLASPSAETISATSWGAVVDYSFGWNDENIQAKFDISIEELLRKEFKIPPEDDAKCKPVLVRIGAACDYAQGKAGPISLLLGILTSTNPKKQKRSPSIWESPDFSEPGSAEAIHLWVNSRMLMTCTALECREWPVLYRIREQLLMQLITTASGHASRPGIVNL